MNKLIIAGIVGIILGFAGSRFLFVGSFLSLVPWTIVGLLLGLWSANTKDALLNGGVYGFLLSFVFLLAGYTGSESVLTRLPFFIGLGIFGAICGLVLALLGMVGRRLVKR